MSVRLSKKEAEQQLVSRSETVKKVYLRKNNSEGLVSRVAVVLDVSGSMAEAFRSGAVQATLERILPLAMAFDDNGSMEVWTFNDKFQRHPPMTRDNFYNYIKDYNLKYGGGTYYAPVMADVGEFFIEEEPVRLPTYVIFITDGDNFDDKATDNVIKLLSNFPIFFQFVGVDSTGKATFSYLENLDNMSGRYVDNANFFAINSLADIKVIDDASLYSKLLDEYPKWLRYPAVKDMISKGDTLFKEKSKLLKKIKKLKNPESGKTSGGRWIDIVGDVLEMLVDILIG